MERVRNEWGLYVCTIRTRITLSHDETLSLSFSRRDRSSVRLKYRYWWKHFASDVELLTLVAVFQRGQQRFITNKSEHNIGQSVINAFNYFFLRQILNKKQNLSFEKLILWKNKRYKYACNKLKNMYTKISSRKWCLEIVYSC